MFFHYTLFFHLDFQLHFSHFRIFPFSFHFWLWFRVCSFRLHFSKLFDCHLFFTLSFHFLFIFSIFVFSFFLLLFSILFSFLVFHLFLFIVFPFSFVSFFDFLLFGLSGSLPPLPLGLHKSSFHSKVQNQTSIGPLFFPVFGHPLSPFSPCVSHCCLVMCFDFFPFFLLFIFFSFFIFFFFHLSFHFLFFLFFLLFSIFMSFFVLFWKDDRENGVGGRIDPKTKNQKPDFGVQPPSAACGR